MSKFIKRQNNLLKAQVRFEKESKRSKQFRIRFERSRNSKGKFRTKAFIVRGEKTFHGNNRGLAHKVFNLKYRIDGDSPSITKTINSFQPKTVNGKFLKKSAQAANFIIHDAGRTAVDTVLTAETVGLKSADTANREITNSMKQKYSREAVDDYHRGTLEMLRIGVDAVKGTHKHFKDKKQYKLEKAKFKLKKAEYDVFKEDKFKPKIQNSRNCQFVKIEHDVRFEIKKLKSEKKFRSKELKNQRKIAKNSKTDFLALKPVGYTADRMKASAWQKAVNEDSDNDMLHALDSAKRRIVEPAVQKISKPERLQRQQKKRDSLSEKRNKEQKRLNKQENKLKEKSRQPPKKNKKPKHTNSWSEKFNDAVKSVGRFIKNIYVKEVGKFFASAAVPILIILIVFAFTVMIFISFLSGSGFILGTYSAQDYDLSEAEKYYTKLAWDLNEKIIQCGGDDWKKALNALGVDTSDTILKLKGR